MARARETDPRDHRHGCGARSGAGDDPVAQDVADRFDHVLVDEYQDTNRLQASILLALKPNGRGLTVVGRDLNGTFASARRHSACPNGFGFLRRATESS
jgi:hypothetical protein